MPKTKSTVASATTVTEPTAVAAVPTPEVKKKKVVRKTTKKLVKKEEPVIEEQTVTEEPLVEPAPVEVVQDVESVEEKVDTLIEENSELLPEEGRRTKKVVNKFKVKTDWDALFELYAEDLGSIKKKPNQKVNLSKYLSQLKNDTFRILKLNRAKREGSKNTGGFMKPVKISDDLANFIKVAPEERDTINRTEITKRICKYVKDNNLQRPDDRREIIPDSTLKKLFSLPDVPDENDKLTYYSIQKKVQSHIFKL